MVKMNDKRYANYDDNYVIIEVLENVAIIFERNGSEKKEVFDTIYFDGNGIYTGYILKKPGFKNHEEFVESGFISNHNIKKIEGSVKRKVYMRKL